MDFACVKPKPAYQCLIDSQGSAWYILNSCRLKLTESGSHACRSLEKRTGQWRNNPQFHWSMICNCQGLIGSPIKVQNKSGEGMFDFVLLTLQLIAEFEMPEVFDHIKTTGHHPTISLNELRNGSYRSPWPCRHRRHGTTAWAAGHRGIRSSIRVRVMWKVVLSSGWLGPSIDEFPGLSEASNLEWDLCWSHPSANNSWVPGAKSRSPGLSAWPSIIQLVLLKPLEMCKMPCGKDISLCLWLFRHELGHVRNVLKTRPRAFWAAALPFFAANCPDPRAPAQDSSIITVYVM